MAAPTNTPMTGEIWHLTIDDLLAPLPEVGRLGGPGPFVINLSASTAPIALPAKSIAGCEQAHIYQLQRTEDRRPRYRLRLGPFDNEDEADAILKIVRDIYPGALTATADADDLRVIANLRAKIGLLPTPSEKPSASVGAPTPSIEKPAEKLAVAPVSLPPAPQARSSGLAAKATVSAAPAAPAKPMAPAVPTVSAAPPAPEIPTLSVMLGAPAKLTAPAVATVPAAPAKPMAPAVPTVSAAPPAPEIPTLSVTLAAPAKLTAPAVATVSAAPAAPAKRVAPAAPMATAAPTATAMPAAPASPKVSAVPTVEQKAPVHVPAAIPTPHAPVPQQAEQLSKRVPSLDATQTVRALTELELEDAGASRWFVIQLSLAEDAFDPDTLPNLDIFSVYRLYSVAGIDQGRIMHALRLGFFTEEISAGAVASYLATFYDKPTIKRVSSAERERFAEESFEPRKDVGATGKHAAIEITSERYVREKRSQGAAK